MNITAIEENIAEYFNVNPNVFGYISWAVIFLFFILSIIFIKLTFFSSKSERQTLKDGENMVFKKKLNVPPNTTEENSVITVSPDKTNNTISSSIQTTIPEFIPTPKNQDASTEHLFQEIKMLKRMLEEKKEELFKKL